VVPVSPHADVNGIEDRKKWETPANAIDDDGLARIGELVENETEEEKMDKGPDKKGPGGWSQISLLSRVVHITRASDGVDVAAKEQEIHYNVHDLEENAILPRIGWGFVRHRLFTGP